MLATNCINNDFTKNNSDNVQCNKGQLCQTTSSIIKDIIFNHAYDNTKVSKKKNSKKKRTTPAFEGTDTTQVRNALKIFRKLWKQHTPDEPVYLSSLITSDMTMEQFCFKFQVGHHLKRHRKGKRLNNSIHNSNNALVTNTTKKRDTQQQIDHNTTIEDNSQEKKIKQKTKEKTNGNKIRNRVTSMHLSICKPIKKKRKNTNNLKQEQKQRKKQKVF